MSEIQVELLAAIGGVIQPGEIAKVPVNIPADIPEGSVIIVSLPDDVVFDTGLRLAGSTAFVTGPGVEITLLIENAADADYDNETGGVLTHKAVTTIVGNVIPWEIGRGYPANTYLIREGDRIAQSVVIPVTMAA